MKIATAGLRVIESLYEKAFPNLRELANSGSCEKVARLTAELKTALKKSPPEPDTKTVLEELSDALQGDKSADRIAIRQGIS